MPYLGDILFGLAVAYFIAGPHTWEWLRARRERREFESFLDYLDGKRR